jgi:hypothetical protein
MQLSNSDAVANFVVPVCRLYIAKDDGVDQYQAIELIGTAFFIGSEGYLMTARHVIDELNQSGGTPIILLPLNGGLASYDITDTEIHPSEDVAIIKTTVKPNSTSCVVSQNSEHSSCEYMLWGYPEHVAKELSRTVPLPPSGVEPIGPELIYQKGYIRRRISRELHYPLIGKQFYEISEVAGSRCSGSPVIIRQPVHDAFRSKLWSVIGIYVGEQTSEKIHAVGYCVRSDSFASWVPAMTGVSISSLK